MIRLRCSGVYAGSDQGGGKGGGGKGDRLLFHWKMKWLYIRSAACREFHIRNTFKSFKSFNRCAPFKPYGFTGRMPGFGNSTGAADDRRQWSDQLDELLREDQLDRCSCPNRQRPFGKPDWQAQMAAMFGLGSTLRPRGRPRNEKKSSLSPL